MLEESLGLQLGESIGLQLGASLEGLL